MTVRKLHLIYENVYYRGAERNNYVTMIAKFGKFEAHGHWSPLDVYEPQIHTNLSSPNRLDRVTPYLWRFNWTQIIRHHLAYLQPKPNYVVINAGMWAHDLNNVTLPAIRQALDDTGMIGIYRTTTKTLEDTSTELMPHDAEACQWIHYCHDVSWTGNVTDPSEYSDLKHFRANMNRIIGQQLLDLLQHIRSQS